MAKTLAGAIDGLGVMLATLSGSGLKRVHGDPPESLSEFPAAVIFALEGEITDVSVGLGRDFHTIALDIYLGRTMIADAAAAVQTWVDAISALLKSDSYPLLNRTVDAIVWPVTYRVGPMQYAQMVLFGVRFLIRVKVNNG